MVQLYGRKGGEFVVSTITEEQQSGPHLVTLKSGGFVAFWTDVSGQGGDTDGAGIKAQLFGVDGSKLGTEFLVNSSTAGDQYISDVSALPGGGFVVTWSESPQDTDAIKAQIFSENGVRIGSEIHVEQNPGGRQRNPSITTLASGNFVVAWEHSDENRNYAAVYRIFDAAGAPVSPEWAIGFTLHWTEPPVVAALPSGGFVLSWGDSDYNLWVETLDANGWRVGERQLVGTFVQEINQQIVMQPDGSFLLVYEKLYYGGGIEGTYGQMFGADGLKVKAPFQILDGQPGQYDNMEVTGLANGDYVVTWLHRGGESDGSGDSIKAKVFDKTGATVGEEFVVNTTIDGNQREPSVTALPSGGFVISWTDPGLGDFEFHQREVRAQIFEPTTAAPSDIAISESTLSETAIGGTEIAVLTAVGAVNSTMTYELLSDSTGGGFAIDGNRLVVADNRQLDFETAPTASIRVRVTDDAGKSYEEVLELTLTDMVDELRYSFGEEQKVDSGMLLVASGIEVSSLASGGYVSTWAEVAGPGQSTVKAQVYSPSGEPVGAAVVVAQAGGWPMPKVTGLATGGFAVAWEDVSSPDNFDIFARVFDEAGQATGGALLVNTMVEDHQRDISLTSLESGNFVVTWSDYERTYETSWSVRGQIIGDEGQKIGEQQLLHPADDSGRVMPSVAALPSGGFIATWMAPGDAPGISAQRYDAAGNRVGEQIDVNTVIIQDQTEPVVAVLAGGGFVITWTDFSTTETDFGVTVKAQIFDASGAKVGGEFRVSEFLGPDERGSDVTALPSGGFLVTWTDMGYGGSDGSGSAVIGRMFDASGAPVGEPFPINAVTEGDQQAVSVATLADGSLVFSWFSLAGNVAAIESRILSFNGWEDVGTANAETMTGTAIGDTLNGLGGNDVLVGLGGDDVLNGGAGADTMTGGAGNDVYVVDQAGDVVNEAAGQGSADEVRTSLATFSLASHGAIEGLRFTGTGNATLTGNGLANAIAGGGGADRIDGGTSADHMAGGLGNDTYLVDNVADAVTEQADGGTDTVLASVNYTLGDHVETLRLTGAALNGTGNAGANTIVGTAGANRLNGGAGADSLQGGLGNDRYIVDDLGDKVIEKADEGIDLVEASVSFSLVGQFVEKLTLTGTAAIDATGNGLANLITGNSQANVINGGAGADEMIGRKGDDVYVVDNALDKVVELTGEGSDIVNASVSYSLAGQYAEVLNLTGNVAVNGTGNGLNNRIVGNGLANNLNGGAGNDRLDGGVGADTMVGGLGNDVFVVDSAGDKVGEKAEEGTDTVEASISYSLAGQYVEILKLTGSANIDATGNNQGNSLHGNAGANRLDGQGGADEMAGGAGDDVYVVDNVGDKVIELAAQGTDSVLASVTYSLAGQYAENLTLTGTGANNGTGNGLDNALTGNAAANSLSGGGGNDVLNGGAGSDKLTGGAGNDTFVFEAGLGASNVDNVLDFAAADDAVRLDRSVFGALTEGALNASVFVAGTAAKDADDRLVYDKASGNLWYDADGSGAGAAVLFANFGAGEVLSAADFFVVA